MTRERKTQEKQTRKRTNSTDAGNTRRWRSVRHQIDALDVATFDAIANTKSPLLDATMPRLTRAADRSVLWIVIAGLMTLTGRPRARRGARSRPDRGDEPHRQPGIQASAPQAAPLDHPGARTAARASHSAIDVFPERTFRERHGVRGGRGRGMAGAVRAAAHARGPRRLLARRDGGALPVRCARRLRPG